MMFICAETLADIAGVNGIVTTMQNMQNASVFYVAIREDTILPPGSQFLVTVTSVALRTGMTVVTSGCSKGIRSLHQSIKPTSFGLNHALLEILPQMNCTSMNNLLLIHVEFFVYPMEPHFQHLLTTKN